jgi:ankyrin repeat protein
MVKVKKALSSSGTMHLKNKAGNTPLIHSIIHHNRDIAALLLEAGADPNMGNTILQNNNNSTPLHFAASDNQHEVLKLLIHYGADPNREDIKALTPLHRACKSGSYECARELIVHKADVNAVTVFNTQPLHYAAERGYTTIVRLLLDHGASLDGIKDDTKPPIYWAMNGLHLETVRELYTRGAAADLLHLTELQTACLAGKTIVPGEDSLGDIHPKDDHSRGKDLNATDIFGRTILFYAAALGDTGLYSALVEWGCDPGIQDMYELKAGDYANSGD